RRRHLCDHSPSRQHSAASVGDRAAPRSQQPRYESRSASRADLIAFAKATASVVRDPVQSAANEPRPKTKGGTMNTPLRSGIFLAPFHPKADNPTLAMERDFELLQHLDRLNYSEAWIGEHHSGGVEIIAAPDMFIAAAAERTRHIRLGTGVS